MIVEFANTWHCTGFGRKRFLKGIVRDVPEQLKPLLPTSAKVLPDNLPTEEQLAKEHDELIAIDIARAAEESTSAAALRSAGLEGLVGVDDETPEDKDKKALAKLAKKNEKGKKS